MMRTESTMFYRASEFFGRLARFGVPPSGSQTIGGELIWHFRLPGRLKAGLPTQSALATPQKGAV
jgi:hypothetical protein